MTLQISRRRAAAWLLGLALAIQAPYFERGVALLDEGTVTANADALARGEILYQDRITLVAPLTYELLAAGYRLFGTSVAVGRAIQAALFAGCVLLSFCVLCRAAGVRWAFGGGLLLLALKPLGYLSWTIANYSPVGLLALLLALAALARWLDERRPMDLALTGLASGVVFVAKQNLAAIAALAVGMSVLAAWWSTQPRRLRTLWTHAGLLLAASLLPVIAAAARYAQLGALDAAFEQAVVGLASFTDAWRVAFPSIAPWRPEDPTYGFAFFAFFPQPVVEASLIRRISLSPAFAGVIETAVKLCYALPLLAVALLAARWLREPGRRAERSVPLACALFAAGGWASMSYRPDWAHLMNVWPLLHVAVVAALAAGRGRLRAALAAGAAFIWLGLAAVACWASFSIDWEAVETPRGRVRVTPVAAAPLRAVLAWDARHPASQPIAYLPALPSLHFLSGRPLPLAVDALIPGVFPPHEEERMLRQLAGVEHVVLDARAILGVRDDMIDVAPRLSHALATQFRFSERISSDFFAFSRATPAPAEQRATLDLAAVASGDGFEREHWLFHRVLSFEVGQPSRRRCAEAAWRAGPGDRVVATPMAHPAHWEAEGEASRRISFDLVVLGPDRTPVARRTEERVASAAPEPWTLSVPPAAGAEAVVLLCVWRATPANEGVLRAGWAEPRVEHSGGLD